MNALWTNVIYLRFCDAVIMFLISWSFTIVSLALACLIYKYVCIKGKAGDWGDGFKSAYFQLALRSLRSLGGIDLLILLLITIMSSSIMYLWISKRCIEFGQKDKCAS